MMVRWPAWLRPGGELATGYDVPDRPIGADTLRLARARVEAETETMRAARLMGEAIKANGVSAADVVAAANRGEIVKLTDDQVDRIADEAGIEVGCLAPVIDETAWDAVTKDEQAFFDSAPFHDPAPGLAETIAAGVPPWAEMQAKYPPYVFDREKARAAVASAKLEGQHPTMVAFDEVGAFDPANQMGEVDFRAMLKNDGHAWGLKAQLEHVLGRPYLATALVDQLTPETAQNLADRLQELLDVRVREEMAKLQHDLNVAVTIKVSEYQREREQRAREVSNERFHSGPTRFS